MQQDSSYLILSQALVSHAQDLFCTVGSFLKLLIGLSHYCIFIWESHGCWFITVVVEGDVSTVENLFVVSRQKSENSCEGQHTAAPDQKQSEAALLQYVRMYR